MTVKVTPQQDAAGRKVAEMETRFEEAQERLHRAIWEAELAQQEWVVALNEWRALALPPPSPGSESPSFDARNRRNLERLRQGPGPFKARRSIKVRVTEPW